MTGETRPTQPSIKTPAPPTNRGKHNPSSHSSGNYFPASLHYLTARKAKPTLEASGLVRLQFDEGCAPKRDGERHTQIYASYEDLVHQDGTRLDSNKLPPEGTRVYISRESLVRIMGGSKKPRPQQDPSPRPSSRYGLSRLWGFLHLPYRH